MARPVATIRRLTDWCPGDESARRFARGDASDVPLHASAHRPCSPRALLLIATTTLVVGSAFALSAGMFIRYRFAVTTALLVSTSASWSPYSGHVRAATAVPSLPPPTGAVVTVSTEPQLQSAIRQLASNTTILIAPGTYQLTCTLYINGVDVHTGANWIVRDNVFRNLVAPPGGLAGPALLMWNHSSNTIAERNLFINCSRGISYGLEVAGFDHSGGIIRNNMIFRGVGQPGDVGIMVADSPNTQVLNNTVFLSGTYGTPIEYRFAGTQNVVIGNNLLDGAIWARDGATGVEAGNLAGAQASMFVDAATGDLHLVASATSAIDRGLNSPAVTSDFDGQVRPQGSAYDIGADEFGATATAYRIGGRVADASGAAVASATVSLSGSQSQSMTSDATGSYAFSSLAAGGTYTVTPSKSGYAFTPTDAFFSGLGANQTANFTAVPTAPATPPGAALAIDVVASGDQTNASGRTLKTSTFSTAGGSELLLAFVTADDSPAGGTVVSSIAGGGLTWQLVRRTNAQVGTAEIWRAFAASRLSNVSVTATISSAQA